MGDILFSQRVTLPGAEGSPSGRLRTTTWLVLFSFLSIIRLRTISINLQGWPMLQFVSSTLLLILYDIRRSGKQINDP